MFLLKPKALNPPKGNLQETALLLVYLCQLSHSGFRVREDIGIQASSPFVEGF